MALHRDRDSLPLLRLTAVLRKKRRLWKIRQNMLKSEENFYLDYQTTRFQVFYKPPWKFPKMLTITERMRELNDIAPAETWGSFFKLDGSFEILPSLLESLVISYYMETSQIFDFPKYILGVKNLSRFCFLCHICFNLQGWGYFFIKNKLSFCIYPLR